MSVRSISEQTEQTKKLKVQHITGAELVTDRFLVKSNTGCLDNLYMSDTVWSRKVWYSLMKSRSAESSFFKKKKYK